ncbi:MAG TPA: Ig-like domain-containing protein, partial [Acidobacteriota bacterium]|nr:Ig-like domain-containing protein [Acidobacteriota bacterium]
VQFTFTFSQAVTGFAAGDIDVVGGSKGSLISESTTVYKMNITPTASSTTTITVDVNAGVAVDANSNGNEAATQSTQTVDTLAPTVAITDDEAGVANIAGGDVQFTFTFSQAVTGFAAGDIDVVGGSKGSLISESTTVYKMNITPTASSTTTITVDVNAGVAVDANSNDNEAATQATQSVDTLAPTVAITDDEAGTATVSGGDVQYTFTFSEAVTGFAAGDIDVTGGSKGSLIAESATVYKMNITPTASSTTDITVDINAAVAIDANSNDNEAATQSVQAVDTTAPSLSISDDETGVANIAGGDVEYTFTFTEAVTGFTAGDIDVVGGTKGSLIEMNASLYKMNITPDASSTTTITVDVDADSAQNAGLNGNVAATQSTQQVDTLAPTVAITDDEAGVANIAGGAVQYTFTFSEAVTGFAAGDIDVVGGTKGSLINESSTVYKMNITPTSNSTTTITVDVNAGVAADTNANDNEAATQSTQTVDTLAPTLSISDDEVGVANIPGADVEYTFTFSQAVTGFTAGDIDVVGGSKGSLISESATVYKMNITPTASSTTNMTVDVNADVAVDANSNGNIAASQVTQAVDTLAPTVTITDDEAGVANIAGGDVQFTFTFSQAVTGFAAGDIDVVGGSKGSLISESTTVYKMNITPTASSTTTLTVDVNADVASDANSNGNEAATQATQSVDTLRPTVAITDDEAGTATSAGGDVQFTFTFSEAVTGFAAADIDVVGGTKGTLVNESTTVYKMNITPTASSTTTITVDVNASTVVDANSNPNTAATQATQAVNTLTQVVTITSPTSKSYNTSFAIVARITNVTGVETNWTLYRFVNTTNYTNATEWMNLTYNHSAGTYVYFNLTWNISALINGNYTLVVNSTDLSGDNVSSNMTVIFDTEDPVIDTFTCSDVDEDDDADCTCDATDNSEAFGGILNTTITTDSTATSGAKDATCVATDAAGNSINATATFDVNKASSGGGGGGGGSGATTTTTTSGTDVSDEDKQILESLDVNLEDVQSVTKLAVVTPPAIAATTLEKIQEKLATLDVPVQAAINTLLTKNNIAAAQVETKTTVYRVTNKDGTKSTFTQVSHEVTVTVPKGATKVQVVEIIPKSVATSASQLSGNFTVLEDDPVIAFNVLVKDLKGGKATVSYNVEGDVSKNITQSSTMVVAPKPTAATPTTATKSPTTTTQPTNSTNTTQQEKPVDYQPDSSGPNMIAMWVMVALIVLIAGGWWFIRIKKKPGSGDDLYMFSEY